MSAKITSLKTKNRRSITCPICSKKPIYPHSPFCSRRCSQLDLGRWLNEVYTISGLEVRYEADMDSLIIDGDKEAPLSKNDIKK